MNTEEPQVHRVERVDDIPVLLAILKQMKGVCPADRVTTWARGRHGWDGGPDREEGTRVRKSTRQKWHPDQAALLTRLPGWPAALLSSGRATARRVVRAAASASG